MDFTKAIDNLHRILTNEERFAEITKSIFDAIDTDNSGTLEKDEVLQFIKDLLKGMQFDNVSPAEDNASAALDDRYRQVFQILDENESGEITLDELGKFLRELFKEQIQELQENQEREHLRQHGAANGMGQVSI